MFRFIKKMAQSEINRATKNRESVKKHIRLELPPSVADFVSAPSGHLRSLSPPSLAAFPGNCSKPSQFPGAHSASQFVFSLIYKKNMPFSCTVKFQADCQTRTTPSSRRLRVCSFRASSFAAGAIHGTFSRKLLQAFAISWRSLR